MSEAFGTLEQSISPGDTVFVYFAGHGVELSGLNYLLPGQGVQGRASRKPQAHEPGDLVEGLPRRVVEGLPQDHVHERLGHVDQHGVPPAHQERHVRLGQGTLRPQEVRRARLP